jgi:antitoxin component of MazEF toxin-antitoxin module
MELSIGKWGNSLAMRIPADVARMMRVVEGSKLSFELDAGSGRAVLQNQQIQGVNFKQALSDMWDHSRTLSTPDNGVRDMRDTDRY